MRPNLLLLFAILFTYAATAQTDFYQRSNIPFNDSTTNKIVSDSLLVMDSLRYFKGCFDPIRIDSIFLVSDSFYTQWFLNKFARKKESLKNIKLDTTYLGGYRFIRTIPDFPKLRFIINGDSIFFFRKNNEDFHLLDKKYSYYLDYVNTINRLKADNTMSTAGYLNELGFLKFQALTLFGQQFFQLGEEIQNRYMLLYKYISNAARYIHVMQEFDRAGGPMDPNMTRPEDIQGEQNAAMDAMKEAQKEYEKAAKEYKNNPTEPNRQKKESAYNHYREAKGNWYSGAMQGFELPSAMKQ